MSVICRTKKCSTNIIIIATNTLNLDTNAILFYYPVEMSSSIKSRIYTIGLCYLCQVCLHCDKDCSNRKCRCKKKKETPENKKGLSRKYYIRTFNPDKLNKKPYNSWQLDELTCKDKYYGYNTNFSEEFTFSLCPKCHNKFNRLGKKKEQTQEESIEIIDIDPPKILSINAATAENTTSMADDIGAAPTATDTMLTADTNALPLLTAADAVPTADPSDTNTNIYTPPELLQNKDLESSTSESFLLELKFKLILKFSDGKSYPAKWEHIVVEDFYSFEDNLEILVQSQLEDQVIFREDYIISYKYEREAGLGTQLTSTRDWEEFLKIYDYSNKKVMIIIVTVKKKANKRTQSR
jgi:hypothetical protein